VSYFSFIATVSYLRCLRNPRRLSLLAIALIALLQPVIGYAQSAASVNGTVSDRTGARVTGSHVELRNQETSVVQSTTTDSSGAYTFSNIAPGNYSLSFVKDGFENLTEDKIVLGVNQAAIFNVSVSPGSVQQTVTVSAESEDVQTSTSELGTVISTTSVNNLPLNGRNFTQLLELTPGVSRVSVGQNSAAGIDLNPVGQFTFPAVNGQRNRSNMFYLDGANDLGTYKGTYNYQPIVDAIQEFKVQSHNDLAEFGGVTGGIINVVTKSGTNALHGSLWEYVRNSDFDARSYFQTKVNPLHQNQFGGSVGGPVVVPHLYNGSGKTFFFFAYEGFRQTQQAQGLVTTATPAQLNGDFSNLLAKGVVIYNPFSTRPDPANAGKYLRDPFPNDQIPVGLLSPAALLYAKSLFPAPSIAGNASGNASINDPLYLNSNSYNGRIDNTFSQRDQFSARVSYYNQPYTLSVNSPIAIQQDVISGYNIVAHELHTFGASTVLDVLFSRDYGRNILQIAYPGAPANFSQSLINSGFSSSFIGGLLPPVSQTTPGITITGYLGTGGNSYQNPSVSDTYEYGASLSRVIGKHNLKAGANLATNNFAQAIVALTETTSTFQTSNLESPTNATGASTGDAMASFLLGIPTAAQRRNKQEIDHDGWVDGFYIQDQFRITPKLSLNAGARWDVSIWPIFGDNTRGVAYAGDMNLNTGKYIISAQPQACSSTVGAPCIPSGTLPANVVVTPNSNGAIHNTDYGNWQIRLGLAYQATTTTSIHLGYGRFYDNWSAIDQLAQNIGGTWPDVGLINANSLNQTVPTSTIGDPLSLGTTQIQPAATPFGNATFYFDPDMKSPRSDQWNVGLDQAFGRSSTFSLGYVGAHNTQLDLGGLQNTAQYAAAGTAADVASRRKYPYIVPTNFDESTGRSDYHALQASLKGRSQGLQYLLSYTWSKSLDVACSGSFGSEGCLLQDPYHPEADRSVSGFDLTHMFSGSLVYELPFGVGRQYQSSHAIVNTVLGGWSLNTITSFSSGTPYSVTVNGDIANTGNTFVRANLVGNPTPAVRTANQWIVPSAFASPARYTFGTFGRNALRSEWFRNADVSVFKVFQFTGRYGLEFRAEAFNITNTAVFAAPNSVVGSPTFGVVSALGNTPRQLQFALKLRF
jgi:hypothetical protein